MNQLTLAIGFGLVTSAILALCAVGFTLQFGVSNILNLAYGDVMTVSAFMAYLVNASGAGIWLAMCAGAATGAVVSVLIGVAAVSMLALHLLLRYTRIGKALRATATDAELARSCGIATERVSALAWAISGALCGLGGVTLALNLASFDFHFGNAFLLVIVAAAVFGSVGQPYGAMVGALVIGMASELAVIWTPALKQVVAFVILALILLVRPAGLWRKSFVQMDV